jgi:hypothetical protein
MIHPKSFNSHKTMCRFSFLRIALIITQFQSYFLNSFYIEKNSF